MAPVELDVRLLSGERLVLLEAEPHWKGVSVKKAVGDYLKAGCRPWELAVDGSIFGNLQTVEELGLSSGAVLQAVLTEPIAAALLFPGEGSEVVGMMQSCADLPVVRDLLENARRVLGWDLKDLCLNGPEERLIESQYSQPAMFVAGMAAMHLMTEMRGSAANCPEAVSGLDGGEWTALCVADVLDFEDGLRLVQLRGSLMQKTAELVPQSQCAVAGIERAKLELLCEEAKASDTDATPPRCQISSCLFPRGFMCGGTRRAILKLVELAEKASALQARVVRAGVAAHTALMRPMLEEFSNAIDEVVPKMRPPRCNIYFNSTGTKVPAFTEPSKFVGFLKKQMVKEVLWEPTIRQMIDDGISSFYELGPGKNIKSMIKRISFEVYNQTYNIQV
mmetsp:Transcript_1846/g.4099  ORF Transcript_1846/g.4099 Transcript_1846/m.4099 type:complete len:392 (-) Transcript_1846:39-1214(-)